MRSAHRHLERSGEMYISNDRSIDSSDRTLYKMKLHSSVFIAALSTLFLIHLFHEKRFFGFKKLIFFLHQHNSLLLLLIPRRQRRRQNGAVVVVVAIVDDVSAVVIA